MLSAARLQRGIFGAGFARLAEAALTEELTLRRRALALHLWQPRAEDEWNHPHDEHFPEDLADSIHHITIHQITVAKVQTDRVLRCQYRVQVSRDSRFLSRWPRTTFDIDRDFMGP